MTGAQLPLSQHDILSASECADIEERVLALRPHWTPRSAYGFFTLGAASYLDAPSGFQKYLAAAQETNALLRSSFEAVLERIRTFLEGLLSSPVCLDDEFACPGFHVYTHDGSYRGADNPAERAHFDLQWSYLVPEGVRPATFSFTLPIASPDGGASLELWHARYEDVRALGISGRAFAATRRSQRLLYQPGRLVLHDGLVLHAIGPSMVQYPKGHRITLQGHGLSTPAGWTLYW